MALLTVRTVPDPVLRQKAAPVGKINDAIRQTLRDMIETMYATNGIGLAANQVGLLHRMIVIDISEERNQPMMIVNPEILWKSEETFTYNEGCLSVRAKATESSRDLYADVTRPRKIRMRYTDETGATKEIEAEELFSQCLQHEIDHLDGVLFIDHLSALKRNMMMKKIEKRKKNTQDDEGCFLP